jgi:hypothetical protein
MIWLVALAVVAAVLLLLGAPYVPTHTSDLDLLFEELSPGDNRSFADLGSGDGRVLRRAQTHGFVVVGFEINPLLWLLSKFRLGWRTSVRLKPWQQVDLSGLDVVYIFSTSWHMRSPSVEKLPKSATIVVYGPQPSSLAGRSSTICGSAVIYQPVAHEQSDELP